MLRLNIHCDDGIQMRFEWNFKRGLKNVKVLYFIFIYLRLRGSGLALFFVNELNDISYRRINLAFFVLIQTDLRS